MTLRAPTAADVPAIAALVRETAAAEGHPVESEAEIRSWLTTPGLDTEDDFRVALSGERLVGYADLTTIATGEKFFLDVRGEGGELLDWGERRARELASAGAVLHAQAWSENADRQRTLEARGFRPARHHLAMQIELDGPRPEPGWPDGIDVRVYDPAGDDKLVFDVHNEVFADAWDYEPPTYEKWRHWHAEREDLDPTLYHLAFAEGELAGYCLGRIVDGEPPGWIDLLGVRRPWRRRGLGLALLTHAFRDFHRRGAAAVGLDVDAENPTGATRLYEGAGMRVARRTIRYRLEI